jgi:hypothetical protein
MIVVEGGSTNLNTWITEERNVYEDYKRAFGEEPPMISGVAIMTDTDNTGESAIPPSPSETHPASCVLCAGKFRVCAEEHWTRNASPV